MQPKLDKRGLPICHDCGTSGNVCQSSDGVYRCTHCSKVAFYERESKREV